MKIKIEITTECLDSIVSKGYHEFEMDELVENLDKFAQAIIYSIPKHDFESFDVIEIYKDGKTIGHGENS